MSRLLNSLKPVNRHLLVLVHGKEEEKEEQNGILLPADYKPVSDKYVSATVLDVAHDCSTSFLRLKRENREIIVDRGMVEKVNYKGKDFHVVLENYVVGIIRGIDED